VHQLRVGLRRWRTAWRELPSTSAPVDPALVAALGDLFRHLNAARDRDVLVHTVAPALAAAGAPPLPSLAASAGNGQARREAAALLRGASTQALWLRSLAWLDAAPAAGANSAPIEAVARQRLRRLHRRVRADAASFASLDDVARHRLRKRVKRLRYLAEFVAVLHRPRATARTLRSLRDAQDALGEWCDLVVARGLLGARGETEPQAWFALGWIAAQRPLAIDRCSGALKRLAATRPFWRHPT
jgi:triphosphatase